MIKKFLHYLLCAITCLASFNVIAQCIPGVLVDQTYFACNGQTAVAATLTDADTTDPNCVAAFAIVDGSGNQVGCDMDGSFTFDDYTLSANTAYYIHSIVGDDTDADGCPDANTTLSSSSSLVYFFEPISYNVTSTCVGGTLTYDVTAVGGGYPSCFPSANSDFTLTTNLGTSTIVPGQTVSFTTTDGVALTGNITDVTGCPADPINYAPTVPCICEVGTISATGPSGCSVAGSPVLVDATLSGTMIGSSEVVTYILHTAGSATVPGTILDSNTTGDFDCSTCVAPCTPFYVSAMAGTPNANGIVEFGSHCDFELGPSFSYESTPGLPTISTSSDTEICIGAGQMVDVTATNAINGSWAITDASGEILMMPASGLGLNFDGAGVGNCNVYFINAGCASSLSVGDNVNALTGCFALSNPITIVRTTFAESAGVMQSAVILTCTGTGATVSTSILSGTGVGTQTYYLSQNPSSTSASFSDLGTIYSSNSTGEFTLSDFLNPGQEAFITAVAGSATSGDCFDMSENSTPVAYYNPIEIDYEFECIGGDYYANITSTGGSPAVDASLPYVLELSAGDSIAIEAAYVFASETDVLAGTGASLYASVNGSGTGSVLTVQVDADGNVIGGGFAGAPAAGGILVGPLLCASEYTVDASCCNDVCTTEETFIAPCLDEVGEMATAAIITCAASAPIVSGSVIPGTGSGDQTYILHSGDPAMAIETNTTGQFDLGAYGVSAGQEVYISAAANYGSPCVEYSNAQSVVYYPPINVEVSSYCGPNGTVCADVTVTGGAPSVLTGLTYDLTFGSMSGTYPANSPDGMSLTLTDCSFMAGSTITATATCCNSACSDTDTDIAPNFQFTGSLCSDPIIATSDSAVVCNANILSSAGGILNYYVSASSGAVLAADMLVGPQADGDFTGALIDNNLSICTEYYISAVYGEDANNDGIVDDMMSECSTFIPGPTLTYYNPVQVHPIVVCSPNSPNHYQVKYTVSGGQPECETCETSAYTVNGEVLNGGEPYCSGTSYTLINPATGMNDFELGMDNYTLCAEDANGLDICIISPIISTCATLPVELVSYTGSIASEGNRLNWVTATELGNDFYTLSKSSDGITFNEIGTIAGAGTTISTSEYSFVDNDFANLSGVRYYKLTQTDFDGRTEEVGVVQLTRDAGQVVISDLNILQLSPVPAVDVMQVEFEAASGLTEFAIYDMTGRVVYNFGMEANNGENIFDVDVTNLASGAYILSIRNNDKSVTERFIKQ